MPRIRQLEKDHALAPLGEGEHNHLSRLIADWQVISDLAKADLIMWLPLGQGRFVAVDHCRPATGATLHYEDVLNLEASPARSAELALAIVERRVVRPSNLRWAGSYSVAESYVPIIYGDRVIAALSVELNTTTILTAGDESGWTTQIADRLCDMVARGEFPFADMPSSGAHGNPRVADGVIAVDADGVVTHISPNARSAFLRLGVEGELQGRVLAEAVTPILQHHTTMDESTPVVVLGKAAWQTDLESARAIISVRAMPLLNWGVREGAVLLCRDVTNQRRRDMEILSKDATIREIHHRVKNNLQTVSALLRLQRRRSQESDVRLALLAAERRVATIASVHNVLAHSVTESVNFDELVQQVAHMAASAAATEAEARTTVIGEFGFLGADEASALAVVIAELVTNSVEHGLERGAGEVEIRAQREGNELTVWVEDRGAGIEEGRQLSGLGTQIVRTLVRGELQGQIVWNPREGGGTSVQISAHVSSQKEERENR